MITRSDPSRRATVTATAIALATAAVLASPSAQADEPAPPTETKPTEAAPDPLDALRERFKEGMERYRAGAYGDAIVIWESIYRELGPDKGYRLAFNLARAYQALGDLLKAAEHYETYLAKVAEKRAASEAVEANVERQETETKTELAAIAAVKGRIRVKAGERAIVTRVDNTAPRVAGFVVYVEPGPHVVRFGEGKEAEQREIVVRRGEIVDVDPPRPVAAVSSPAPRPAPRFETRVEHPFPQGVIWATGALTVASVVVPVLLYSNASSIKSEYDDASKPYGERQQLSADYDSARSNAYASLAVPSILAVSTGGLLAWYVFGSREIQVPLTPAPLVSATGGGAMVSGRF